MLISGHVQLVTFWSREAVTVFLEPKMSLPELAADVYVLTRWMLIHLSFFITRSYFCVIFVLFLYYLLCTKTCSVDFVLQVCNKPLHVDAE